MNFHEFCASKAVRNTADMDNNMYNKYNAVTIVDQTIFGLKLLELSR